MSVKPFSSRTGEGMTSFSCETADLHPFACDGPGKCEHCDQTITTAHDPDRCVLCDDGIRRESHVRGTA